MGLLSPSPAHATHPAHSLRAPLKPLRAPHARPPPRGTLQNARAARSRCPQAPLWCLFALCFSAPLAAIAPLRAPFAGLFALLLACVAVCSALGAVLSAWFGTDCDKANLAGVIIATIANLFGGFVPLIGTGAVWAYTRWTARAFAALEVGDGYGLSGDIYNWVAGDEWQHADWPRDLGVLALIALLLFGLALLISLTRFRDKRR